MSEENQNLAETIFRQAREPQELGHSLNSGKLFAVPDGWSLKTDAEMERLQERPFRKKGNIIFTTSESFVDYVNLHKTEETRIYAVSSENSPLVVKAVFNENQPAQALPGWCDFTAAFVPKTAFEWETWTKNDRKPMSQFDFAVFVEENLKDIYQPPAESGKTTMPSGAQMLEMAIKFEVNSEKRLKSTIRLQSGGSNLDFVDNDDAATVERMSVFDKFSIGIPVFWKAQGYVLNARLRYRNQSGKLALWYELIRPDLTVDDAVNDALDLIEKGTEIKTMQVRRIDL